MRVRPRPLQRFNSSTARSAPSCSRDTLSEVQRHADQTMKTTLDFAHEFVPGRSERTLLVLHGTGGNEHDLIPLGREIDPDAAILSPRGKILENGMPRFFRRLAEGIFDEEDLRKRTHELAEFVGAAAKYYGFAADHVLAVGYSNGANIAASMLLLRPEILRAAVLFRAMVPLMPEKSPDLSSVRVWIGAGNQDPIIQTSETERLVELLRAAGADVTLRFSNAGHGLITVDVETARAWVEGLKA
jgi:phospholipase/carboxylesterase